MADASYVVNGTAVISEALWNPVAKENNLLRGKIADLWTTAKDSIYNERQRPAEKVTSHCTAGQVARGEVPFENYAGNGIADVLAKIAARFSAIPKEEGEHAENIKTLAFLMSVRVAIIEAKVQKSLEEEQLDWEVKLASNPILMRQAVASVQGSLKQNGHDLVHVGVNRTRCRNCHKT